MCEAMTSRRPSARRVDDATDLLGRKIPQRVCQRLLELVWRELRGDEDDGSRCQFRGVTVLRGVQAERDSESLAQSLYSVLAP